MLFVLLPRGAHVLKVGGHAQHAAPKPNCIPLHQTANTSFSSQDDCGAIAQTPQTLTVPNHDIDMMAFDDRMHRRRTNLHEV